MDTGTTPLTNVVPPPHNSDCSHNCQYEPTPWWLRILEAFGIVSAIAYAIITWCMWRDSHNNFMADERAWLNVTTASIEPTNIKEGSPIQGGVLIMNTGKTFCKKPAVEFVIEILKNTDAPVFQYTKGKITQNFAGLLAPNGIGQFPVTARINSFQAETLTKGQVEDLEGGRAYVVIYGRGIYWDIFAEEHWFHYCGWKNYYPGGEYTAARCVNYNDAGDGPLPEGASPESNIQ